MNNKTKLFAAILIGSELLWPLTAKAWHVRLGGGARTAIVPAGGMRQMHPPVPRPQMNASAPSHPQGASGHPRGYPQHSGPRLTMMITTAMITTMTIMTTTTMITMMIGITRGPLQLSLASLLLR